ncbi:hypothetical protein IC757_12485 [Wenzhouxiangella sp. AB-CW3]|uniref:hypothetical protein n=1 Tax=Wenzhouxiangella sp. AB-CW3 TaxID=2771012 RepID=UPI00168A85CF|nr:hypothetical protein [Wenzhouxiangella sp. AB-CW3]QOC21841.1 hypothetical protein IC757_12485 [Wenzhouxiangella sp. AB-CW3]
MPQEKSKLLFVPVSGPVGSGEYYRCLNIARAMARRRDNVEMHFLLSRHAEVERESRFHYHLLEKTPTLAGTAVERCIDRLQPDLAVFDCSGRKRHFRRVKQLGGKLAWISNRPHKRRRGFHPQVLPLLDLHLIGESCEPDPALTRIERGLLKLFGPARVDFFTTVAPESVADPDELPLELPEQYAVFASGGGGYEHLGRPVPELFLDAARRFHEATGLEVVTVMGPQYRGGINSDNRVHVVEALSTAALGRLLAGARLGVLGAGFMLSSQALAARIPMVLTAVGGRDQPGRVKEFDAMGIALPAALDAEALSHKALELSNDPALARQLVEHASSVGICNDVAKCAELLLELID